MLFLIKNNFKEIRKFFLQFAIIALIFAAASSNFVALISAVVFEYAIFNANAKQTNLDNFVITTNSDYRVEDNLDTDSTFFSELAEIENDSNLVNNGFQFSTNNSINSLNNPELRSEFSLQYLNNQASKTDEPYLGNTFTFLTQDRFISTDKPIESGENSVPSLPDTGNGEESNPFEVFVPYDWANYNNLNLNSTFKLFATYFQIYDFLNASALTIPVGGTSSIGTAYNSPFIISAGYTQDNDEYSQSNYGSIRSSLQGDLFGQSTNYLYCSFYNNLNNKQITSGINEITSLINSKNVLSNNFVFANCYNRQSLGTFVTSRVGFFFQTQNLQTNLTVALSVIIIGIAIFLMMIITKKQIDENRVKIGVLKAMGFRSSQIAFSGISSSISYTIAALIIGIGMSYIWLAIDNGLIQGAYLLNIPFLQIQWLIFLYVGLVMGFIIILTNFLITLYTLREPALKLLQQKQKFGLKLGGAAIMKRLSFMPFVWRFGISSLIASGFRTVILMFIVLAAGTVILVGLLSRGLLQGSIASFESSNNYNYTYGFNSSSLGGYASQDATSSQPEYYEPNRFFQFVKLEQNQSVNDWYSSFENNPESSENYIYADWDGSDASESPALTNLIFNTILSDSDIGGDQPLSTESFVNSKSLVWNYSQDGVTTQYYLLRGPDQEGGLSNEVANLEIAGLAESISNGNDTLATIITTYLENFRSILITKTDDYINLGFMLYQGDQNEDFTYSLFDNTYVLPGGGGNVLSTALNVLPCINNLSSVSSSYFTNLPSQMYRNFLDSNWDTNFIANQEIPIYLSASSANAYKVKRGSKLSINFSSLFPQGYKGINNLLSAFGQNSSVELSKWQYYVAGVFPNYITSQSYTSGQVMNDFYNVLWNKLSGNTQATLVAPGIDFGSINDGSNYQFNAVSSKEANNYLQTNSNSQASQLLLQFSARDRSGFTPGLPGGNGSQPAISNFFDVGLVASQFNTQFKAINIVLDVITGVSVGIGALAMIALNYVVIRENLIAISLLRVFGYRKGQINLMYMLVYLIPIIAVFFASIGLAIGFIYLIIDYVGSSTSIALSANISFSTLLYGFFIVIGIYLVSLIFIQFLLNKIKFNQVLQED